MYKDLIKNYVEKLKKEDVIKFIENNNYVVSDKEIDIIYFYIKNYCDYFLEDNKDIWAKLKKDVSEPVFIEIRKLFNKYKKYI